MSDFYDGSMIPDLARLRALSAAKGALFEHGPITKFASSLSLRVDPAARISGTWQSPQERLLEVHTTVEVPGAWLALHLALDLPDLEKVTWFGLITRSAAGRAVAIRPCLRSGLRTGGFQDCFFDRHILSHGRESDHWGLIAPDRELDLPAQAPWRELILFLPSSESLHWSLHDLRIITL